MSPRRPPARPAKKKAVRKASAPRRLISAARDQAKDVLKGAIVAAAERVFARSGYDAAKVTDIAREAGVAAGTLYNYFDSKEAVFQSLCEVRGRAALAEARAIAELPVPALDRLRRHVDWVFSHVEAHEASFQLYVQLGATAEWQLRSVAGEAAHDNYLAHLALVERALAEAQGDGELRRDLPARTLAFLLAGMINSTIHLWLVESPRAPLAPRAAKLFDLFCKGAVSR